MNKKTQKRTFTHLSNSDRDEIEILIHKGYEQKEVARVLGCDPSTISREICRRRRKNGYYSAKTAKHKAGVQRSRSKFQGMKIEKETELRKHIIAALQEHRSP